MLSFYIKGIDTYISYLGKLTKKRNPKNSTWRLIVVILGKTLGKVFYFND